MHSSNRIIITFGLIFLLTDSLSADSFCQSFADNKYRISYVFRRMTANDRFMSYVFIGNKYWRLRYYDNRDDNLKRVEISAEEPKHSDWFGSHISQAFCVWFGDECRGNASNKDDRTLIWTSLDRREDEILPNTLLSSETGLQLPFINLMSAFVPNWGQTEHKIVILFQQKPKIEYQIVVVNNDLSLGRNREWEGVVGKKQIYKLDPRALIDLVPGLDVIGVLGQYSRADYDAQGGNYGHGLVVLFQYDRSIRYCYTYTERLSQVCKRKPKLLIDCSQTKPKITSSETIGEPEGDSTLLAVIVITSVFGFTLFTIVLWVYRTMRNEIPKKS